MTYKRSDLKRLNNLELAKIAATFNLEVKEEDVKKDIIEAILLVQNQDGQGEGESNVNSAPANDAANETPSQEGKGESDDESLPPPTPSTPPASPAPAKGKGKKEHVFLCNLSHNGASYAKGDSASSLEEALLEEFIEAGYVGEPAKEKPTQKDAKEALKSGAKGFEFVRNVMHNGVLYEQGQSADGLEKSVKESFVEQGLINLQ